MAGKNYYSILGICQSAAPEGVRAAFRSLAKRYHPDRAGTGSAERFREIHEAYAILSDPRQRGAYDSRLSNEDRPLPCRPRVRCPAEPLIPLDPRRQAAQPISRRQVLSAEVLMTPAEARVGGAITLTVPSARPCPACAGGGGFGPLACELCASRGVLPGERTVTIRLPPMASAREIYEVKVDDVTGLVLHLDVRVATG